jgi:hypothetical protein
MAGARQGMAGEWHGNGRVCVNPPLDGGCHNYKTLQQRNAVCFVLTSESIVILKLSQSMEFNITLH